MKDKRRKYDMRCLKCGYANQMSARFCVNCGSRLGIESAKKIQAENYNNIINNQNQQQQFPQQGQSGNPNGNMQMSNGQKQPYQQQQFPQQGQSGNPNGNMQMGNGQKQPYQQQQFPQPPYQNPNGNVQINNGQKQPYQQQQFQQPPYQNPNGSVQINNGQYQKQGQQINPNGNMQMSNGQKQPYQQQPYQQQGQQINPNGNMQINNGQYPQQGQQINPNGNMYMNNGQQELPMKWHNFLVYAGFLLGILYSLGSAIKIIISMTNTESAEYFVYEFYKAFKVADIIVIIINVFWCVVELYVWREMMQKRRNGWKKYIFCIIGASVINCIKWLAAIIIFKSYELEVSVSQYITDIIAMIICCSISVVLNNIYYKKRDHLFVN